MRDMRERKDVYSYESEVEVEEQPDIEEQPDDDDTGNTVFVPTELPANVIELATGLESIQYEFSAKTRVHDRIIFAYAQQIGSRLLLFDGEIRGIESEKRETFDILEIDYDALVWLTARRK